MSRRIAQINSLLRRAIGSIILRDIEFPLGSLTTIVDVKTSGDLKTASITVSIFPESIRGTVLTILKKHTRHIELLLQEHCTLRPIPALSWKIDTTEEKAADVEALLDHVRSLREKNLE